MVAIVEVRNAGQLLSVKDLFLEYADSLGIDLHFQGFEQELATLPGKYAPPGGALLLAESDRGAAGCVAIRPLTQDICEMKRLYVRPAFRGTGLGRRLAEGAMGAARQRRYTKVRLDTLASMSSARSLYGSLGFKEIDAYYDNPIPGAVYLEACL
jgi:ribosomal protein S18 acetylase RimI-like enzyme